MDKLNTESSKPLYKQLEQELISLIQSGAFPKGSRFPTEKELGNRFNVSRVTIRKALAPLTEKGLIERISGKGTFVAQEKLQRPLSNVISFTQMCEMQGFSPGAKTISFDISTPFEEDAKLLHLQPDEKIVVLKRVRYADSIPVIIETTKFTENFFFLFDEDLTNTSLYNLLKKHNIYLTSSSKTIDIILANFKQSKYLNVKKNYPLLRIKSVVSSEKGDHRHLSEQLCVANRFKFQV